MNKKIIILIIILLWSPKIVFSQFSEVSQSAISLKLEVERNVKSQIENLLNNLVGQNKYNVLVNAVVTTETTTTRRKVYIPKKAPEEIVKSFLPGIPSMPKKGGEGDTNYKDESIDEVIKQPRISKILITIFLSDKVDVNVESKIREAVNGLSIAPQGGEMVLDIKRAPFKTSVSEFLTNQQMVIVIGIILTFALLIFLFGPVRGFMKNFVRTLQERKGSEISVEMPGGAGIPGAGGVLSPAGTPLSLGPGKANELTTEIIPGESIEEGILVEREGARKIIRPFSFVKKSNLQNLVYLVQNESPEIISLILSYLTTEEAANVISSLPSELQGKVALAMATLKQASAESVIKAEENIKKRIDFLIGGLERFVGIMDSIDGETRDEILSALEKENSVVAERVKKEMFIFENIVDLDNSALQLILREVRTDSLAKALKDATEDVISKVMKNISAGAATLLKEEMDLNVNIQASSVYEERKKIVGVIRKMEKEGKITVKRERKKSDKVFKIEKLEETFGREKEEIKENKEKEAEKKEEIIYPAKMSEGKKEEIKKEEKLFTKALSQETSYTVEKKVSLSDYKNKKEKGISIAGIFGEIDWKKADREEKKTNKKEEVAEELFTGGKSSEKQNIKNEVISKPSAPAVDVNSMNKERALEHYKNGLKKYEEKKFDDAIMEFQESARYNGNLWQTYLCLGHCYRAKKTIDEMVRAYKKSLELNPNNRELNEWLKQYEEKIKVA